MHCLDIISEAQYTPEIKCNVTKGNLFLIGAGRTAEILQVLLHVFGREKRREGLRRATHRLHQKAKVVTVTQTIKPFIPSSSSRDPKSIVHLKYRGKALS